MAGGGLALIGFLGRWDEATKIGAFIGFVAWVFACLTYVQNHFWFALVTTGLFHAFFQAYVYLATALGVLRRKPIY